MLYLALSYDHRLIDGREAVSFLVRVEECIEASERMLLDARGEPGGSQDGVLGAPNSGSRQAP